MRVLPLRTAFQRFPRLIREMSAELGKPATLRVRGRRHGGGQGHRRNSRGAARARASQRDGPWHRACGRTRRRRQARRRDDPPARLSRRGARADRNHGRRRRNRHREGSRGCEGTQRGSERNARGHERRGSHRPDLCAGLFDGDHGHGIVGPRCGLGRGPHRGEPTRRPASKRAACPAREPRFASPSPSACW